MKNCDWEDVRWAVVKADGSFAGVPCASYEEARDLAAQHEGSKIFFLAYEPGEDEQEEDFDDYFPPDMGFDPYEGAYTFDC